MTTLTRSLQATPALRLLERPVRAAGKPSATAPTLLQRFEAWVETWPEPTRRHRLGSWMLMR